MTQPDLFRRTPSPYAVLRAMATMSGDERAELATVLMNAARRARASHKARIASTPLPAITIPR